MRRVAGLTVLAVQLGFLALMGGCDFGIGPSGLADKGVYYRYTYAARNADRELRISADGVLEVEQINGTEHAVGKMQLSEDQRRKLGEAFRDWKSMKPYYNVIFGPVYLISYDGYKVESSGDKDVPEGFLRAANLLDQLADEALAKAKAARAASAPATSAPASVPATQR